MRYTRKWNRYYRYFCSLYRNRQIKQEMQRKNKVEVEKIEPESDDLFSEESEDEPELIHEQLQLEEQSVEGIFLFFSI